MMDRNNREQGGDPPLHLRRLLDSDPLGAPPNPDDSITAFVPRAARNASSVPGERMTVPPEIAPLGAETLLRIVLYCYAKGIVRSVEIEHRLAEDGELRAILGVNLPRSDDIQYFRRWNRERILAALQAALTEYGRTASTRVDNEEPAALARVRALEILESAIIQDREETEP